MPPPGLRQFSSHLHQVVWPRNFKLEKLKKYDGKENPENCITLYEIAVRSGGGDEHVMANYFPVVLDQAGHQWLLGLPEDSFGLLLIILSLPLSSPETNTILRG